MNTTESDFERVLITFIGLGGRNSEGWEGYNSTTYFIYPEREKTFTSKMSAIAITNIIQSYDTVVALVTNRSEELVPSFEAELPKKCRLIPHRVSEEVDKEDILSVVSDVVQIIETVQFERKKSLVVDIDITHGFRHLPVLYFAAMSFLSTFRKVTLGKI